MLTKKYFIKTGFVFIFPMMFFQGTHADPLAVFPSARAYGMAASVTASVNDNSALYYNPAGLTSFLGKSYGVSSADYTQILINNTDDCSDDTEECGETNADFTVSFTGHFDKWGIGIGYYNLGGYNAYAHSYYSQEDQEYKNTTRFGNPRTLLVGGLSYALISNGQFKLSVGAAVGIGMDSSEDETLTSSEEEERASSLKYYDFGLKTRLFDTHSWAAYVGYKLRISPQKDQRLMIGESTDMPSENNVGIALNYKGLKRSIMLTVERKIIDYANVRTMEHLGEYVSNHLALEISGEYYALRAGLYQSAAEEVERDVEGVTLGIGFWKFDFAIENRTYQEQKDVLMSVSFTHVWW
ncbi:MAG: hypothetical protein KAH77_09995 [Thiomargarita sp.]|nr:hypothetical protein [Thiomargarita sp.]